jgi:hypothetical protein
MKIFIILDMKKNNIDHFSRKIIQIVHTCSFFGPKYDATPPKGDIHEMQCMWNEFNSQFI